MSTVKTFEELLALPQNVPLTINGRGGKPVDLQPVTAGSGRNFRINNCTFNWVKLVDKVEFPQGSGNEQWELQVMTDSLEEAAHWHQANLVVKEEIEVTKLPDGTKQYGKPTGFYTASLKRKAKLRDGTEKKPAVVVDSQTQPMSTELINSIGNGSTGSITMYQYHWTYAGKSGITSDVQAVQVSGLRPKADAATSDFDIVPGADVTNANSANDASLPNDIVDF